jgi:hypothetical protein
MCPVFEFECPACGNLKEAYVTQSEAKANWCPDCDKCLIKEAKKAVMNKVISKPALPQIGGAEGKLRMGEKLKKRNDAYHNSPNGQAEHRANIEGARKRGLPC